MYKDNVEYVRSCPTCQTCKIDQRSQIGLMGSRKIEEPGMVIAIDLIGELPRSKKGYKYLIVFQDVFTKYIICAPIKKKTAEAVRNAIENIMCIHLGTPEAVLTDNGKEFINSTITDFLADSAIQHIRTPAYHPQSNPVERVNRDLKIMISAFIDKNHKEWDKYIPQFQFAHNTSAHATTGKTPAFLMFGRELKPPKFWRREAENHLQEAETSIAETRNQDNASKVKNWENRIKEMHKIYSAAAEETERETERQAAHYNRNKREFEFKIGDLVLKKNKILSSATNSITAKLAPNYIGPYKIKEIISRNIYKLTDKNDKELPSTCHSKELKPYRESAWHKKKKDFNKLGEKESRKALNTENIQAERNKRKRGRPRKSEVEKQPIKRARGRPRKICIEKTAEKTTEAMHAATKRKRGRPRESSRSRRAERK